ncbi:MAG: prolipoprotein diacylglyceryl transferase [Planctomycetia bacterium]|nr:prolipoprotein diacylglyceryl transferase [Planctomycetia bacterium]
MHDRVFFPAAAIFARVICGITDHWPKFRAHPIQFVLSAEKFSAFGGVIGGVGSFALCNLWLDMGFGLWAIDAFALALIAGEIVSRFGCHANGCCYGRTLTGPRRRGTISVRYVHPLQKAVWHGGHDGVALYAAPLYRSGESPCRFCRAAKDRHE